MGGMEPVVHRRSLEFSGSTFTCSKFISEFHASIHHGDGHKVLHLHFLPSTEEDQAVSLQGLELELNSEVIVDVC